MQAERLTRRIRSFVRREGRFTPGQRRAFESLWPRYGIDATGTLDLDTLFGRHAPRTLEIGFGNGENLAHMAASEPDVDFLGIEVHRPGVGRLLQTLDERGLTNVRVICADAVDTVAHQLSDHALQRVLILFPDPWHKKRHHKRRLVQPGFVSLLARKLSSGGILHVATDWEDYARHTLRVLDRSAEFSNTDPRGGYVDRPGYRAMTRFERRGLGLGHAVRDLVFRRR